MKAPINWLREFVDIDIPLDELARRLTLNGLETKVEYRVHIDPKIIVAQITAVSAHPNAERLRLVTVDIGSCETTVVCGAPNVNVGDKVAFAQLGSIVKNGQENVELKSATIRGVESCGMICAEDELGISASHEGILVLNEFAPIGESVLSIVGEATIDVEITSNRADCMSIMGIAYEVAAACDKQVRVLPSDYQEIETITREYLKVRIINPNVTSFYSAAFIGGVKVGPSPQWMQDRLITCGVRPVNNIVDVTNYMLLEVGLPMHAFDYDKLESKSLIVRSSQNDQKFVTLDGKEHVLKEGMGIICDGEKPVALAGIMGGLDTSITDTCQNVALEAACFNPASIHKTSHALNISTEASTRFERGLSAAVTLPALKRGIHLILQVAGGYTTKGLATDILRNAAHNSVEANFGEIRSLLGLNEKEWPNVSLVNALKKFGIIWNNVAPDDYGDTYSVQYSDYGSAAIPYHRSDVKNYQDLAEEVARGIGYDKLPLRSLPSGLPSDRHHPAYVAKNKVRLAMSACGFWEVITHGLTNIEELQKTKPNIEELKPSPLKVLNPMAGAQEYLRTNMRGALLSAIRENRKHEDGTIKLYELGRVFIPRGEGVLPAEPEMLYAALVGDKSGVTWPKADLADFFSVKGTAEVILDSFGIKADFVIGTDEGLLEGQRADVVCDGKKIGVVGQVHPIVCRNFDLHEQVFMLNFSLSALIALGKQKLDYYPVNHYQKSERDVAFIVDEGIKAQALLDLMKAPLVQSAKLFDVYSGKQVPQGKKSLAFRLTLQAPDRTLMDAETEATVSAIVASVQNEFGASLRS